MPAIEAEPSSDSAVVRRRANHARQHGRAHDRTGGRESHRRDDAEPQVEVPELGDVPRRHQRGAHEDRARHHQRAGAEPIDQRAHERLEHAVDEQAHRDHEREAAAIEARSATIGLRKGPMAKRMPGGDETP
jgi:hypothetical protein